MQKLITTECELRKFIIETYAELKRRDKFLSLSEVEQGTVKYFSFYAMPNGNQYRVSLKIHGLKSIPKQYKNILGSYIDMLDMADIKTNLWDEFIKNKSESEYDRILDAFGIDGFCVTTNERCHTAYLDL